MNQFTYLYHIFCDALDSGKEVRAVFCDISKYASCVECKELCHSIWDNCTKAEKMNLKKIQNEAARIATGATKLVSNKNLYKDICWESLQNHGHKLTLFYKMYNHLAPEYLSSLIPQQVNDIAHYILRNSHNIQTIRSKKVNKIIPFTFYLKSLE